MSLIFNIKKKLLEKEIEHNRKIAEIEKLHADKTIAKLKIQAAHEQELKALREKAESAKYENMTPDEKEIILKKQKEKEESRKNIDKNIRSLENYAYGHIYHFITGRRRKRR